VEWQFRVASGQPLPLQQSDISINGHAVEVRIYAEDPENDFLPATGTLSFLQTPKEDKHTRIDTGVRQGDLISVHYDPMLAKLIVWDENRTKALQRLSTALSWFRINGVTTNVDFLSKLASSQPFMDADLDTGFIDKYRDDIFRESKHDIVYDTSLAALYLALSQQHQAAINTNKNDPYSPWNLNNGWRLNEANLQRFEIICHEQAVSVDIEAIGAIQHATSSDQSRLNQTQHFHIHFDGHEIETSGQLEGSTLTSNINGYRSQASIAEDQKTFTVFSQHPTFQFSTIKPDLGDINDNTNDGGLTAPMNGTIVALLAQHGATVTKGDALLVMEAMKMEHTIRAPADGIVQAFYFKAGDLVDGGTELVDFEISK